MSNFNSRLAKAMSAIALLTAVPACAHTQQKPTPVSTTTVAAEDVELGGPSPVAALRPALWKVSDEDTTIYLFGTVHVLPKGIVWYDGKIAEALQSSDKLITEIYVSKDMEAQAGATFLAKGMLPEGKTLRGLLTAEQKEIFEAGMTTMGLPVAAFDRFEPWLAAVNISMIPLLKAGYSPDSGVEKVLEAKAGNMARGELESVDFQVDLFDSLPMDSQIKFMMEAASGVDEIVPTLDIMVGEWVSGDPEGLGTMMNEGFSDPVLAETLLYARNQNWAEWIDTRLDAPGTIFIAVGAGHLAGDESVQEALEDRGIATIRVQ